MRNLTISDADLRSVIVIKKETRSGQYICDCPFCSKENHFYIDKKTQLFECKKCWTSGNIYKLLKYLDKTYLIGEKSVEFRKTLESIREHLENESEKGIDAVIQELPERRMPAGFKICRNNAYLASRGVTDRDCKNYHIGETELSFKYRDYILMPVYDDGVIRGFLGRYGAKKVPENRLRYNNSLNTEFGELLYGYDEIIKGETEAVIVVEGVFDKISVDKKLGLRDDNWLKCVATFGKKISDVQIKKLMRKNISTLILSWDFDALKEIKERGMELTNYFDVSVAVSAKKKDLGDCSKREVVEVFKDARPITEFVYNTIGKLKR